MSPMKTLMVFTGDSFVQNSPDYFAMVISSVISVVWPSGQST